VIAVTGFLLLPALLVASAVDVRSTTECPASAVVLERLRPLLPSALVADETALAAHIDARSTSAGQAAVLHLRLLRADGHVIGERDIPAQPTCEETADTMAAIIAAWATPSPPSLAATASAAEPVVIAPPFTPPVAPLALFAGAAGGAAVLGGTAASGGLELLFGRESSRWQLRLGASTTSARQLALAPGQVEWQHTSFVAGLVVRARHPDWLLAVDAGPSLGWAFLAGQNFWREQSGRSFEWGVESGLRAGRVLGRFALWAEARATLWAQGQQARLGRSDDSADLPVVDVALRLGLSVRVF
jgi:hypothetical protein